MLGTTYTLTVADKIDLFSTGLGLDLSDEGGNFLCGRSHGLETSNPGCEGVGSVGHTENAVARIRQVPAQCVEIYFAVGGETVEHNEGVGMFFTSTIKVIIDRAV